MLGSLGLRPGCTFEYVFDLGDSWRHRCEVQDSIRLRSTRLPGQPVPIWGWGRIPDQYGRVTEEGEEE
jgi:hypothetical protein